MGLFTRLKNALLGTRNALVYAFKKLTGRIVNADFFEEVYETLVGADIGVELADRIVADLKAANVRGEFTKAEQLVPFLKDELRRLWPDDDLTPAKAASGPTVILVVGVNGSGKTTSVAKLAALLQRQGGKVLLAACDTFRAAAVEQLTIWAGRAGVEIVKHNAGGDPAAVAFDACTRAAGQGYTHLVVDTAGRLHTQKNLMDELDKIRRVIAKKIPGAPHEVLLVLDATTGQNAVRQAEMFGKTAGVTGVFLSKLDGSAKGGVVIAVRQKCGLPVKYVGTGEKPDDVETFNPGEFIDSLFEE